MRDDLLLRALFFGVFIGSVSACANTGVVSLPTETAILVTSTPTASPTVVLPTATSTPVMTTWANKTCWERQSLDKVETDIAGSLFYWDWQSKEYRLLNLETKKSKGTNLSGKSPPFELQISPDGEYFSLLRTNRNELVLFSKGGGKTFSIPAKTDFMQYLNGSQILFGHEGDGTEDQLYILNPKTGEWTVKPVSKPGFPPLLCWDGGFKCNYRYAAYSPDLKYVFYMDDGDTNYLFDIDSKKLVENQSGGYDFGDRMWFPDNPVWKRDASAVTIFDPYNYYNIGLDGELVQLTNLGNLFPSGYVLTEGVWSPTGRYLAFMALTQESSLYIFDTRTNTLINPCVSEDFGSRSYWPIFWSPTQDIIALDIGEKIKPVYPSDSENIQTIVEKWPDTLIIDIAHQSIYQVPNTMRNERQSLFGWLSW